MVGLGGTAVALAFIGSSFHVTCIKPSCGLREARGRLGGRHHMRPDGRGQDMASLLLDDFRDAVAHFGKHPITVSMTKEESTGFNHL